MAEHQLTRDDVNNVLACTLIEEGVRQWWDMEFVDLGLHEGKPLEVSPNYLWEKGHREWVMSLACSYLGPQVFT